MISFLPCFCGFFNFHFSFWNFVDLGFLPLAMLVGWSEEHHCVFEDLLV